MPLLVLLLRLLRPLPLCSELTHHLQDCHPCPLHTSHMLIVCGSPADNTGCCTEGPRISEQVCFLWQVHLQFPLVYLGTAAKHVIHSLFWTSLHPSQLLTADLRLGCFTRSPRQTRLNNRLEWQLYDGRVVGVIALPVGVPTRFFWSTLACYVGISSVSHRLVLISSPISVRPAPGTRGGRSLFRQYPKRPCSSSLKKRQPSVLQGNVSRVVCGGVVAESGWNHRQRYACIKRYHPTNSACNTQLFFRPSFLSWPVARCPYLYIYIYIVPRRRARCRAHN